MRAEVDTVESISNAGRIDFRNFLVPKSVYKSVTKFWVDSEESIKFG